MSRASKILLVLAALLAGFYLGFPEKFTFPIAGLIKAAPIWILALIAWREAPFAYRVTLSLALLFSGVGDFALAMEPAWAFPAGMAAFLIAHLFYLWIFTLTWRSWSKLDNSRRLILALIGLYTIVMAALVLPATGALMPAIAVYFVVLSLMAAASFAGLVPRWTRLGAIMFVLSDTLIGIDRFVAPLEFRHFSVMLSYYAAQVLIMAGIIWQYKKPSK